MRWPWPLVLLAAAVVVTVIDPWALLQPGFWLSFAAVGLLMASAPVQQRRGRAERGRRAGRAWQALRHGLRTQVVATLGLAPLTLVFFQQVSLVGFVANLVAIPLVTLLITPLALLGVLRAAAVAGRRVAGAGAGAVPAAGWRPGRGRCGRPRAAPRWAQLAGAARRAAAGAAAALARCALLAVPLMLPLFVPPPPRPADGRDASVAVVDVGQGSAVLVRTRSHLLVYDAGPAVLARQRAGTARAAAAAARRGDARIDLLMLSHRDTDHVGGAAALLAALPVAALSSVARGRRTRCARGACRTRRCEAGQRWAWDGVRFDGAAPAGRRLRARGAEAQRAEVRAARRRRRGPAACCSPATSRPSRSSAWCAATRAALRSDVLVVPHHGSRTSSTPAFLDAVAPQVAVVQAGYRNRFGHPAPTVLARYAERGIAVARSDGCGAWQWSSADSIAAARCERDARPATGTIDRCPIERRCRRVTDGRRFRS